MRVKHIDNTDGGHRGNILV